MDWTLFAIVVIGGLGLFAGAFLVAQSPAFWVGFVTVIANNLWPIIWAFTAKRNTPEEEEAWRKEQLRGTPPIPKGTGVTTSNVIKQPAAVKKPKTRKKDL